MIVSIKYNFVFLCMPKCASTSTEAILRPFGQLVTDSGPRFKHINLRTYERFVKPLVVSRMRKRAARPLDIEVICLFREPIDWLHSWYRYRRRQELLSKRHSQNSTVNVGFVEFAREYVSENPLPFAKLGRQSQFVRDRKGNVGKVRLFRYEDYPGFLAYMSAKVGEELTAPHLNASPEGEKVDLANLGFLVDFLREEYAIYNALPARQ